MRRQLKHVYGTLRDIEEAECLARIHSITTDTEETLTAYLEKKLRLINEYSDKGGKATE